MPISIMLSNAAEQNGNCDFYRPELQSPGHPWMRVKVFSWLIAGRAEMAVAIISQVDWGRLKWPLGGHFHVSFFAMILSDAYKCVYMWLKHNFVLFRNILW